MIKWSKQKVLRERVHDKSQWSSVDLSNQISNYYQKVIITRIFVSGVVRLQIWSRQK